MAWIYVQRTGSVFRPDGKLMGRGYSGHGNGLNNPAMDMVRATGPIPRGSYKIGPKYQHPHLGPIVMNIDGKPGTDMHGRSLFRIHGDNSKLDHSASDGCIILARPFREEIARSEDRDLIVVPDEGDVK